jgi:hypothetical protein
MMRTSGRELRGRPSVADYLAATRSMRMPCEGT